MITVSKTAAEQIQESAKQGNIEGVKLRIAATKKDDGSIEYVMGFEDRDLDEDIYFESEGIKLVTTADCYELLKNTEIDFVKLDGSDEMQFIFKNPNDPAYIPTDNSTEHHF